MNVRREILKLAAEVYDLTLERGEHFALSDIHASLVADLTGRFVDGDRSVVDDLIAEAAWASVREVDKTRTSTDPAASLLDSLDQAVAVAESQRIARRRMRAEDWAAHLAHVSENAARVNAAAARENTRFAALSPYLVAGVTTEEAVRAWQMAHPGGDLP